MDDPCKGGKNDLQTKYNVCFFIHHTLRNGTEYEEKGDCVFFLSLVRAY